MNTIKYTIAVLSFALSFGLQAGEPEAAAFLLKDAHTKVTYSNTSSNFVREKENRVIALPAFTLNQETKINTGYITGQAKKVESSFTRVLHWNFKVKFRLNRNMNIIFSYN